MGHAAAMSSDNRSRGATELLGHFLPQQALGELRDRALRFQRDEQFRIYLLRRLWFIIPIAIVSVLAGTACAAGAMLLLLRFVPQPSPGWLVFGIGALVWFATIIPQIVALFAWLHRRAFSPPRRT